MIKKICRRVVSATLLFCSLILLALVFIPSVANVFGQLNLFDTQQGLPDLDNRAGVVKPNASQISLADSLGAKVEWNKFGTVHTMLKYGGFLSTGLSGDPVSAARQWIRANRTLFRLSDQAVTDLELVSDGTMPYSAAHAVLFRQRFGNLAATQDGLINVAIVNGNVYHVWSSSAGDQAAPGAATLTPVQGWLNAAANVNQLCRCRGCRERKSGQTKQLDRAQGHWLCAGAARASGCFTNARQMECDRPMRRTS